MKFFFRVKATTVGEISSPCKFPSAVWFRKYTLLPRSFISPQIDLATILVMSRNPELKPKPKSDHMGEDIDIKNSSSPLLSSPSIDVREKNIVWESDAPNINRKFPAWFADRNRMVSSTDSAEVENTQPWNIGDLFVTTPDRRTLIPDLSIGYSSLLRNQVSNCM